MDSEKGTKTVVCAKGPPVEPELGGEGLVVANPPSGSSQGEALPSEFENVLEKLDELEMTTGSGRITLLTGVREAVAVGSGRVRSTPRRRSLSV